MAEIPRNKFDVSIEEIGNGFLVTGGGYKPWYCKSIDEVNTSIRKKVDFWYATKVPHDKKETSDNG